MTREPLVQGISTTNVMSIEAQYILQGWVDKGKCLKTERPGWDEYYLGLAFYIACRSRDAQTHCGCVITDRQHRPLGFGYNSFVRQIDDSILPNVRPDKYPFMIHAELNAIFNCSVQPNNGIAYVTGCPCPHCLQCLWQVGIREIVIGQNPTHMQQETREIEEILIKLMRDKGLVYREVEYDPDVLNQTHQA